MNHNRGNNNLSCYLHPNEVMVGVCSLCLKERLLILASKQEFQSRSFKIKKKKIVAIAIPKIFGLRSFRNLFDLYRRKQADDNSSSSSSSSGFSILSLEDSFISIKFDGGVHMTWDKEKGRMKSGLEKDSLISISKTIRKREEKSNSIVVDHGKQLTMLRWRKRIGYIFKLAQWSGPSKKVSKCHVGVGVDGVKKSSSWIRSFTRRRTATV